MGKPGAQSLAFQRLCGFPMFQILAFASAGSSTRSIASPLAVTTAPFDDEEKSVGQDEAA